MTDKQDFLVDNENLDELSKGGQEEHNGREKLQFQELYLATSLQSDQFKEYMEHHKDPRPFCYNYVDLDENEDADTASLAFVEALSKDISKTKSIEQYDRAIERYFAKECVWVRLSSLFRDNASSLKQDDARSALGVPIAGLLFYEVDKHNMGKMLTNAVHCLAPSTKSEQGLQATSLMKIISINECDILFGTQGAASANSTKLVQTLSYALKVGKHIDESDADWVDLFASTLAVLLSGDVFRDITKAGAYALLANPPLVDIDYSGCKTTTRLHVASTRINGSCLCLVSIHTAAKNLSTAATEDEGTNKQPDVGEFTAKASITVALYLGTVSGRKRVFVGFDPGICTIQKSGKGTKADVEGHSEHKTIDFMKASAHYVDLDSATLPVLTPLYGWGAGSDGFLGYGGKKDTSFPLPITVGLELGLLRVRQISCSAVHAAAVTDVGLLYTWGMGSDGALGHGSLDSRNTPTLVSYFGVENPLVVTSAACGSDNNTSHTVVVAEGRRIFGGEKEADWELLSEKGIVSKANENPQSTRKSALEGDSDCAKRGRIFCFGHQTLQPGSDVNSDNTQPQLVTSAELNSSAEGGIKKISCGGGFVVVLTNSGRMFSWGKVANGRLGLGPQVTESRGNSEFKAIREPAAIMCATDQPDSEEFGGIRICSISCGGAHALALTTDGVIYSWGRNVEGQLGDGTTLDRDVPVVVHMDLNAGVKFVSVATGTSHSLAISENGGLFSWGGIGDAMLGHGDYLVNNGKTFSTRNFETKLTECEFSSERKKKAFWGMCPWLRPREVLSFRRRRHERILQVDGGDYHTVAITVTGEIYMWGTIASTPDIGITKDKHTYFTPRRMGWSETNNSGPIKTAPDTFRLNAIHIAVAGSRNFVLSVGSSVASDMRRCLPSTLAQRIEGMAPSGLHQRHLNETASYGSSHSRLDMQFGAANSSFRIPADAVILVDGHRLDVHKVLLSLRSTKLKKKFADHGSNGNPVEIVLPDLSLEVALCMLEFIYSDNLSMPLGVLIPHLQSLYDASSAYGVPKLASLCRLILYSPLYLMVQKKNKANYDGYLNQLDTSLEAEELQEDASRVFSFSMEDDLLSGRDQEDLSDLVFRLEDDMLLQAHQLIVASRSEFFRGLLSEQKSEQNADSNTEIVLPDDSLVATMLVHFMYTNELKVSSLKEMEKTSSEKTLLKLFQAADRYGIHTLKSLCESVIVPSEGNLCQTLDVADRTSASLLKQKTMSMVLDRFDAIYQGESFRNLQQTNPGLVHQIRAKIQERNHGILTKLVLLEKEGDKQEEDSEDKTSLPIMEIGAVILLLPLYFLVAANTTSLGYLVPAINVFALITLAWYLSSLIRGE